jgi:hypothetical protein
MKTMTQAARRRAKDHEGPLGEILITVMIVVLVLLTLPK